MEHRGGPPSSSVEESAKLLADSYYNQSPSPSPVSTTVTTAKKSKKKKKHKKSKISREEMLYLSDHEILAAEASHKQKKAKRKKYRKSIEVDDISPSSTTVRDQITKEDLSPPRKKSRTPRIEKIEESSTRSRHSGSRSPFHSSLSPRRKNSTTQDIPSAYAGDRSRSPTRNRKRSSSRSPSTVKLNQKREKMTTTYKQRTNKLSCSTLNVAHAQFGLYGGSMRLKVRVARRVFSQNLVDERGLGSTIRTTGMVSKISNSAAFISYEL
eukprot:sb/3468214/